MPDHTTAALDEPFVLRRLAPTLVIPPRDTTLSGCWAEECHPQDEEWLVEGLVPARAYVGLFGRRGSAKSFVALEMAFRGALGQPFLGRATARFGVLYCVGEKKAGFQKRVAAWRHKRGDPTPAPLWFHWSVPNLLDAEAVAAFVDQINALKPAFSARGAALRLLVLDTLSRCLGGRSVSDADVAGQALEAIQFIVDETGLTVMPIAHVAKALGSDSFKGAGEWENHADALLRVERDGASPVRTITNTKQSDDADGGRWAFELELVDLGLSPAGRPLSSCVVRETDAPLDPDAQPGRRRVRPPVITPAVTVIRQAMDRLAQEGQTQPLPALAGPAEGRPGVMLDALRQAAFALDLHRDQAPQDGAPEADVSRWKHTRRMAFARGVDALKRLGQIRQEGDWVWLA